MLYDQTDEKLELSASIDFESFFIFTNELWTVIAGIEALRLEKIPSGVGQKIYGKREKTHRGIAGCNQLETLGVGIWSQGVRCNEIYKQPA